MGLGCYKDYLLRNSIFVATSEANVPREPRMSVAQEHISQPMVSTKNKLLVVYVPHGNMPVEPMFWLHHAVSIIYPHSKRLYS